MYNIRICFVFKNNFQTLLEDPQIDVNKADKAGVTPLMVAAFRIPAILIILLKHPSIDVNPKTICDSSKFGLPTNFKNVSPISIPAGSTAHSIAIKQQIFSCQDQRTAYLARLQPTRQIRTISFRASQVDPDNEIHQSKCNIMQMQHYVFELPPDKK